MTKTKIILAVLLAAAIATPALAQPRATVQVPHRLPSNPLTAGQPQATTTATVAKAAGAKAQLTTAQVQQNPILLLQTFTAADLQAALQDANAQNPPDTVSAMCYTALLTLANNPINNPLPTQPGLFLALQKARDAKALLLNLQSATGPLSQLNVACAPLILDAQNTLLQLGLVTGAVAGTVATGGLASPSLGFLNLLPKL